MFKYRNYQSEFIKLFTISPIATFTKDDRSIQIIIILHSMNDMIYEYSS